MKWRWTKIRPLNNGADAPGEGTRVEEVSQARSLDAAASERKRLLASLQDLLLDEAYVQYRNYQPPTPPSYSGYDQQPWGARSKYGLPSISGK